LPSAFWNRLNLFRRLGNARARFLVNEQRIAALEARLSAIEARGVSAERAQAAALARMAGIEGEQAAAAAQIAAFEDRITSDKTAMLSRFGALEGQTRNREAAILARIDAVQYSIDAQERQLAVRAFMDLISHIPSQNAPLELEDIAPSLVRRLDAPLPDVDGRPVAWLSGD